MANIIYTRFFSNIATADQDWNNAGTVIRAMAERDTSTYTPNKDHDFVGDLTSFVEITSSGYSRQTVSNKAVNIDDANDRVELDFDDISFGSTVASGQAAEALIFYQQTGGDDLSPNDDPLICRIDTATGLPATLGGGAFSVTINAEGFIQLSQP